MTLSQMMLTLGQMMLLRKCYEMLRIVMSLLCKRGKLDVALKKLQNYLKGGRRFSFEGEKSKTLHFVESFFLKKHLTSVRSDR